ncbi:MAG: PBP1A family penicillin-binding protein [Acidobacteriota bacterium]
MTTRSSTARRTRRAPARRGANGPNWRRRLTIAGVVAALGLIGLAAWLFMPFWTLSGQFGEAPSVQPSRLYGAPTTLRPGDGWTVDRLRATLDALGYAPLAAAAADAALAPGTYRVTVDGQRAQIEIGRRRHPQPSGMVGPDWLWIALERDRVTTVAQATPGGAWQGADQVSLDPPLIASFYGPQLRERRPTSLDAMPETLIYAVLAMEDTNFLDHAGVSVTGVVRAAWVNLRAKGVRQGGSTLTQQLVKNLYLTHERTLDRKLQEVILALLLEQRYDKRAILEAYLNEIYFGRSGSVHLMGVGAAAWAYFGKAPAQLELAESALLAGMIQAPMRYAPLRHPEAARARRDQVLARLTQLGWVSEDAARAAAAQPIETVGRGRVARSAPYFADAMAEEARARFGVEGLDDAGYALLSTLRPAEQAKAEAAVTWGVDALEKGWEKGRGTTPLQAALISVEPATGGILAYVGGRDYGQSQFDRVGQAQRQAGSIFKPIVYAAAFRDGLATPATMLEDAPLTVTLADRRWSPQNSDETYRGWLPARRALEESLNVPTARLAMRVGIPSVAGLARDLGVTSSALPPYPALALGAAAVRPREMASVYATLANGGRRPPLHGLVGVLGRDGAAIVPAAALPAPSPVLSPQDAFLITDILRGVLDRGTGRSARDQGLHDALAGKTGTTNSRRDSWFAGYGPERATVVWVGYDDNARTRLSGARAALPIWARFTAGVRPPGGSPAFVVPEGIVEARINPVTGGLATTRCPRVRVEVFRADNLPARCHEHDGFWAEPLEPWLEPGGPERERRNPLRRWLDRVRGRDRDDPSDAI